MNCSNLELQLYSASLLTPSDSTLRYVSLIKSYFQCLTLVADRKSEFGSKRRAKANREKTKRMRREKDISVSLDPESNDQVAHNVFSSFQE